MGYDAISTGFCDTRINAGGSCIKGEANWCNMECLLLPGAQLHYNIWIHGFLVELSWTRVPQTNVKKAISP